MIRRFRVWLARLLLRSTGCLVARAVPVAELQYLASDVARYIRMSGGLQDPRRIRAYRTLLRRSENISRAAGEIQAAA